MNRLKALYRSWGIPRLVRSVGTTLPSGMARQKSMKPASGDELNTTTSSLMSCGSCARRCDGICWGKRRSTKPGNCCARFRDWSDPGRFIGCADANASSVPYQATALDLQRPGISNS